MQATFTVTLAPPNATQAVTVNYATANGSATAGSDYVAANGTLTFDPSVTSRTISVAISGDTTFEPNETFVVNLSQPVNAVIGDAQGTGTITNDDAAGAGRRRHGRPRNGLYGRHDHRHRGQRSGESDATGSGCPPPRLQQCRRTRVVLLERHQTPPAAGTHRGNGGLHRALTPGTYHVRLFANDGYTRLATSGSIKVVPGPHLRRQRRQRDRRQRRNAAGHLHRHARRRRTRRRR